MVERQRAVTEHRRNAGLAEQVHPPGKKPTLERNINGETLAYDQKEWDLIRRCTGVTTSSKGVV